MSQSIQLSKIKLTYILRHFNFQTNIPEIPLQTFQYVISREVLPVLRHIRLWWRQNTCTGIRWNKCRYKYCLFQLRLHLVLFRVARCLRGKFLHQFCLKTLECDRLKDLKTVVNTWLTCSLNWCVSVQR